MVAMLGGWPARAGAQAADPDPARFESEIAAFAAWDAKNSPPSNAILFVGSSSIRMWPTADRFPELDVINRGFGGSQIPDVNHYFDQVVRPYDAPVIVFYAGDNDINAGRTPQQLLYDYREFVSRAVDNRGDVQIVYVPLKPSLARWSQWATMQEANQQVRDYSRGYTMNAEEHAGPGHRARLYYADIAPPMLGADGKPRPELFVEDGLHMTPAGYDIWTDIVGRAIHAALASTAK
jgi:lysophospholipase L1-like esterase